MVAPDVAIRRAWEGAGSSVVAACAKLCREGDWMPDLAPIYIRDILDVIAVAAMLWALIVWLRRARARLALIGLIVVGALYVVARLVGFALTAWIFQGFFAVFVIIVVVVFQEDLRRLFEGIAVWSLRRGNEVPRVTAADVLVRSVARMAASRTGALIVLPGRTPLDRHLEGGIELDARISEPLLLSLFDSSSPGHDGAVLVKGGKVSRFAVHLPLSTNQEQIGPGGTRHAAGLGLAERADCLCIVVSEERGTVSVARDGELRRLDDPQKLAAELEGFDRSAAGGTGTPNFATIAGRWREAALALGLASALWFVRVPGSTVAEVVRTAPVVVDKLPSGFELESVDPESVNVTVQGLRRDLIFQSREAIVVRLDALLVKLGRRTFQIDASNIRTPAGLEVVDVDPPQVVLSVRSNEPAPEN